MQSSGGGQAAQINNLSARHEQDLFNLGYPGFRIAMQDFLTDLGQPGSEPDSVRKAMQAIRGEQTAAFDRSAGMIPGAVNYQSTVSGYRGAEGATEAASKEALFSLERRRRAQGQLLDQQESDLAMQQRDFDMGQILGMSGGALASARGFTNTALMSAGYRKGNPWGSALSGAAGGALAGAGAGVPGIVVGGVLGGLGGYFGGGG